MTKDEFTAIMDGKAEYNSGENRIMLGLQIITKYIPMSGIEAAEHDIIYSAGVDEILEAGLTKEDAKELCRLGWQIDDDIDVLAYFV